MKSLLGAAVFALVGCATTPPRSLEREMTVAALWNGRCWQRTMGQSYEVICGRGEHTRDEHDHFVHWTSAVRIGPDLFEEYSLGVVIEVDHDPFAVGDPPVEHPEQFEHGVPIPLERFQREAQRRGTWSRLMPKALAVDQLVRIGRFDVTFERSTLKDVGPILYVRCGAQELTPQWVDQDVADASELAVAHLLPNGDLLVGAILDADGARNPPESWGVVRAQACTPSHR